MSLQVEIRDGEVRQKTIQTKNGPMTLRNQTGRVQLPGESETRPVEIGLADDEQGYNPGRYVVAPDSFFVGSFDRLQVGRVRLRSVSSGSEGSAKAG